MEFMHGGWKPLSWTVVLPHTHATARHASHERTARTPSNSTAHATLRAVALTPCNPHQPTRPSPALLHDAIASQLARSSTTRGDGCRAHLVRQARRGKGPIRHDGGLGFVAVCQLQQRVVAGQEGDAALPRATRSTECAVTNTARRATRVPSASPERAPGLVCSH
jgi:hypothetical protein